MTRKGPNRPLWYGSRAQHAGSIPQAVFRLPGTQAECFRSRRSLVIWGMSVDFVTKNLFSTKYSNPQAHVDNMWINQPK